MTSPIIENLSQSALPEQAEEILQRMFEGYVRVIVLEELSGGFVGRVFLLRPIRQHYSAELPAVVKLAPANLITQEWEAYQRYVRDLLPSTAPVKGKLVLSADEQWGGLRYGLAGSGRFDIQSLHQYCGHASLGDIDKVLKRLFQVVEKWWQQGKGSVPAYRLQDSYSRLLPVHLEIEPGRPPSGAQPHPLTASNVEAFKQGEWVQIEEGIVRKTNRAQQTVLLDLVVSERPLPATCYVTLVNVQGVEAFSFGQRVRSVWGQVTATRAEQLHAYAQAILPKRFELAANTIKFPDGPTLPNPLHALPKILRTPRDVHVAHVHGDLNLENILVDSDTGDITLIDFGYTGRDHVLHDLLRLETEVVTKFVPEALRAAGLPQQRVISLYGRLHEAVHDPDVAAPMGLEKPFAMLLSMRRMAARHLYEQDGWAEYYQGLVVYLLGALRFPNLDETSRRIAFYSAALALQLVEGLIAYEAYGPPSPAAEEGDSRAGAIPIDKRRGVFFADEAHIEGDVITGGAVTKTEFHGPVTGPIHTGSGDIHVGG